MFTQANIKTPAWLLATAGVLLCAALAHAQTETERFGDEYQTCNTGQTQSTVECVDKLIQIWEARLNGAYERALDKLPAARQDGLRAAQRAWIEYRDTSCRWYASGAGSIARLESVECMRSLTAARALELQEVIEER